MNKEKVIIIVKKNCEKCVYAKELGKKLEDKYKVTYKDLDTIEGLAEFVITGATYPPVIINGDRIFKSVLEAKRALLG